MSRREDYVTTDLAGAARFEAHHGIDLTPTPDPDTLGRTFDGHDECCGGDVDHCWGVMAARALRAEFGGNA